MRDQSARAFFYGFMRTRSSAGKVLVGLNRTSPRKRAMSRQEEPFSRAQSQMASWSRARRPSANGAALDLFEMDGAGRPCAR